MVTAAAGAGLYPSPPPDFAHPASPHAPQFSIASGTNDRPLLVVYVQFTDLSDYVFATAHGTAFLHHNVSKRVLRRAAADAGLDRDGRRLRFHDLRHTFASHLIIDIRLDVA